MKGILSDDGCYVAADGGEDGKDEKVDEDGMKRLHDDADDGTPPPCLLEETRSTSGHKQQRVQRYVRLRPGSKRHGPMFFMDLTLDVEPGSCRE